MHDSHGLPAAEDADTVPAAGDAIVDTNALPSTANCNTDNGPMWVIGSVERVRRASAATPLTHAHAYIDGLSIAHIDTDGDTMPRHANN